MPEPPSGSNFRSIPILDWSELDRDRPGFLRRLRHALVFVGFMYCKNLPLPAELVAEVERQTEAFFELPLEQKMKLEMKHGPHFLGYSRQGNEITKLKRDNREQLDLGNEVPCKWKPGDPAYQRLWGPNQWPDEAALPGFRAAFDRFMTLQASLSIRFTGLIAESLGLRPDAFAGFYDAPVESMQHRLKCVKYPAVDALDPGIGDQGVGPHTDGGFLTLLLQASPLLPGLQVQAPDGEWIPAPPVPGTFVVNIGKGMETATQGVCIATTHRVVNPPPGAGPRYSVPFFQNVSHEARLGDLVLQMPDEMLKLRDLRGPVVSDSGNYREMGQLKHGEVTLINRIRAHPDAGKPHYPELYKELFPEDG